jgi:hypothetical protein
MARTDLPPLDKVDPAQAWQPWQPTPEDPWNLQWAGHLYRRAAFGPTRQELRQALTKGMPSTVELLLGGQPHADSLLPTVASTGRAASLRNNPAELRGWWLYWMLNSGHPLREKMTLFWHNHFATSIVKVGRAQLMFGQNNLLRHHALGSFGPFLLDMSKDVAMLIWLDSNSNVKAHPNENYAREVMELFSLGVGNYTEKDIREAARAFTGWHTDGEVYEFNQEFHDDGPKTVLGKTGNWNGDDIVRILLGRPDTAQFLIRKLYTFFISETYDPPHDFLEPLADSFRKSSYDIKALLRTMLSSRHFYSGYAYRQRVKSPVEFVLGSVRAVATGMIPQQPLVSRIDAMGQQLFAPPNVKGWRGGQNWLNTSTVLARQNFCQALAMGRLWQGQEIAGTPFQAVPTPPSRPGQPTATPEEPAPAGPFDPARLIEEEKAARPEDIVRVLVDAYLPGGITPANRDRLVTFVAKGKPSGAALSRRVRETVHAILSMPESQLA